MTSSPRRQRVDGSSALQSAEPTRGRCSGAGGIGSTEPGERFRLAHLSALRTAAGVSAERGRPASAVDAD